MKVNGTIITQNTHHSLQTTFQFFMELAQVSCDVIVESWLFVF